MVKISNISIALAAASTALLSTVHADTYTTLAEWKQSAYYQEALAKQFLPPTKGGSNTANAGEFSMDTSAGTSSYAAEETKRFNQAVATVEALRKQHPHATFSLETPFALLTHDEFLAYVNRNNVNPDLNPLHRTAHSAPSHNNNNNNNNSSTPMPIAEANTVDAGPKTSAAAPGEFVDWQQQGCVTAVKDQAQCGACWAFSATAAIESGRCVATGGAHLPNLADQELISCDNQGQSQGCGGGYASYTIDWIAQARAGKMCTLASYPFTSSDGRVADCKLASCTEVDTGVTGFEAIRKDPSKLEDAVRARPVSVFLYSGSPAFQFYTGGVLTGDHCDKTGAHSGLAVGFGTDNGTPYWRVKNQWGTKWGEDGYVRIQRRYASDDEGACGVELYASYPTFKADTTVAPTSAPTVAPTVAPTTAPTTAPTAVPTSTPTTAPTTAPTAAPTATPTAAPTAAPTVAPTAAPTVTPSTAPTETPTAAPTSVPTETPTQAPTPIPTAAPTSTPTQAPTETPTQTPSTVPTLTPTQSPIQMPTAAPIAATAPPSPVQTIPFLAPVLPNPFQFQGGETTPSTVAPASDKINAPRDDATSDDLQVGVDFLGNDLVNMTAATVAECHNLCRRHDGCNAFTFTTWKRGACFLKSRAGLVVPNSMATSGSLYDLSAYSHANTPQEVGYDYPGNDLAQVAASHATDCYGHCSRVVACHAFTWSTFNGGTCFLKTRKSDVAAFRLHDAMRVTSAIVYKCAQIQHHTDVVGHDMGSAQARSPEACCALCHHREGCAGFAWSDYVGGTCWFKTSTADTVAKGSVVSASM